MSSKSRAAEEKPYLTSVTRSLAVNVYQIRRGAYDGMMQWFDELETRFDEKKLAEFVVYLGETVGAKVLNLSSTPYEPHGASAALLVGQKVDLESSGSISQHQLAHLNASHIAAHSYFDRLSLIHI